MRNLKLKSFLLVFCFAPALSLAKIKIEDQGFEAIVSKVNAKTVIVVHRGKLWEVPKKSIQSKSITPGNRVDVVIAARDLASVKVTTPKLYRRKK